MTKSFDLIVVGAGSGGLAAAKRAAAHGAKVAIIEGDRVGGTCVIRGCVPKKLLLYGSLYKEYIANAESFGVKFKDAYIDSSILLSNVRKEVDRLNSIHINLLHKSGVELINGWAHFINAHSLIVESNCDNKRFREVKGERILIAVGGYATRPSITGSELGWVSDDIFLQNKLPKKMVVLGAGYIACEFSCILNSLGVSVTQYVRGHSLLRGFDMDLSKVLEENMQVNGINLNFQQSIISIKGNIGNLNIKSNLGEESITGAVLFAIGRKPRINDLKLFNSGVISKEGRIIVDEGYQTNIPHIYAVGDVTNLVNLTPVAIDEGRVLADNIFSNSSRKVNYKLIAKAIFSQPEVSTIGLTEDQAVADYGQDNIQIYKSKFNSMATALPKRGSPCLLKLIVETSSQKVIGCHMVGEHASEIIQMAAIAIGMGATKYDFDKTMALHPTIAEEFVTMR